MALGTQIMTGVGAGFRAIGNGFAYIGRGIAHVSSETWNMWRDVFLEEYNGIAQYTIGENNDRKKSSRPRSEWLHAASYLSTLGILPTLLFLRTLLIDPIFYHNAQLTGPWFRSMADFGLPGEDKRYEEQDTPNYKGWARLYYVYAWPGAAVGAFVGSFFAMGHLGSSFVFRALCAAVDAPAYLRSLELEGPLKKNEMIGTGKNWAGIAGYYTLGAVLSVITVPVFYAARIIGGSFYSFLKQAGLGIRDAATLGDAEEETLDEEETTSQHSTDTNSKESNELKKDAKWSVQDVLNLPGTIPGYGAYVVAGLATLAIRIPLHTVAATWNSIAIAVNASLYNFNQKPGDPSDDFKKILSGEKGKLDVIQKRTLTQQVLGSPGYLIGGAIGIVVGGVIGFGRGLVNLPLSFGYAFGDALDLAQADLALTPEEENTDIHYISTKYFSPRKDARPPVLKILGGLGYGLGYITGLVGAVTVMVPLRFLANSVDTIVATTMSTINFAWNEPDTKKKWVERLSPNHHTVAQHVFGIPGTLILLGTVPVTYVLIAFVASVASPITYAFDLARKLPNDFNAESAWKKRSRPQITVGVLTGGYFIGAGLGLTTFAVVGAGRIGWNWMVNCYKSGEQSYQALANIPLEKGNEYEEIQDDRGPITTYAWGGVGLVIGLGVGIVGAAFFAARRTLYNSFDTFKRVSGSTMNVAMGHPYFNNTNVRTDVRSGGDAYGWGLIGAIVTAPIIAVAATYGALRLSAQYVAPIIGAAVLATPIAVGKLWNRWFGTRRFDETQTNNTAITANTSEIMDELSGAIDNNSVRTNEATPVASSNSHVETMKRFKNLASSLNGYGNFTEGADIKGEATGGKGCNTFFRKAFTFNQSTPTEYILDQLLKAYQKDKKKAFTDHWNTISKDVHEWYGYKDTPSMTDMGLTKEEKTAVNNMLNDIATFIIDYIKEPNDNSKRVPVDLYKKSECTVAQVWRGERLPVAEAVAVDTPIARVSITN